MTSSEPSADVQHPLAGKRIMLGVSASIAAYKAADLCSRLVRAGADVRVLMTPNATQLVGAATFEGLTHRPPAVDIFQAGDNWEAVLEQSAHPADLYVIAPCTADCLARIAAGMANDFVAAAALAATCPILIAPAMATPMWENPRTRRSVERLKADGVNFVGPADGRLASGRMGAGRMAEPQDVFDAAVALLGGPNPPAPFPPREGRAGLLESEVPGREATTSPLPEGGLEGGGSRNASTQDSLLSDDRLPSPPGRGAGGEVDNAFTVPATAPSPSFARRGAVVPMSNPSQHADPLPQDWGLRGMPGDLAGRAILITAGPTQEALDPVRMLTNRSTGKMGIAVAQAAAARGAVVTLVLGPTSEPVPSEVTVIRVTTAAQMRDAAMAAYPVADIIVATAAVSDYRPAEASDQKLKKADGPLTLTLERTPDILAEMGRSKQPGQILIGFAAETESLIANAKAKLTSKSLDAVVANDVTAEGAGFAVDTNVATWVTSDGCRELGVMTKRAMADTILDAAIALSEETR